jgi:methyl-accepting chemotaxis protein
MKGFKNTSIRTRITTGFLLVALVAAAIGAVGIFSLDKVARLDTAMYQDSTRPLGDLVRLTENFQQIHNLCKDIILAETTAEIENIQTEIKGKWQTFDAALAAIGATLNTQEGKTLIEDIHASRTTYANNIDQIANNCRYSNSRAALVIMRGSCSDIQLRMGKQVDKLVNIKTEAAAATAAANEATAGAARLTMLVIMGIGVALSLLIGILIAGSISKPLRQSLQMLEEMARGRLQRRLHLKSRDEVGQMAQAMDRLADDLQSKVIANLNRIAAGDVSSDLELLDEQDEITPALIQTTEAIRSLVGDTNQLVEAAVAGRLETRADVSRHQGDYARIVDGVNRTLDAVIQPVEEASAVLKAMAEGNLQLRVEGEYQGDHAAIKTALNETLDALAGYVQEIAAVLTEMAHSNLDVAVEGDYRGDFAPIKTALKLIMDNFNTMLAEMNRAAEQVAAGSRQVSDGSQALSRGTTEQASSIEQLNASITEIAAQTRQNALNAGEASELASKAQSQAIEGNSQMRNMVQAMAEINDSSTSISRIIKVIDEIAFQTNILALNAAVEAARAGQHGKGFAVVAEEVRNLAARSAQAAQETTALIEGSIQKVTAGTRIAGDTARALDQIVSNVSRAADLAGSIAAASNEQATGIAQINQGVEQVSRVVQANSATSEESAATSEELSSQAEVLRSLISQFRLRQQERRANQGSQAGEAQAEMARTGAVTRPAAGSETPGGAARPRVRINLNDIEFGKY